MKIVLDYLNELQQNNNKEWFDKHKAEYKQAQNVFNSFVQKIIEGIASFDPSVSNLTIKDCTYRIYRDIRFSKDKTPYKTHMGAYIAPKGKNAGFSGYYFHLEAKDANYIGGHMLSSGVYMPEPRVLKSIREEIMLNGEEFVRLAHSAQGFSMEMSDALKRVPTGFSSESPFSDYFKLKNYFMTKKFDDSFILEKNSHDMVIDEFKKTLLFNNLINRCIDYAYENM